MHTMLSLAYSAQKSLLACCGCSPAARRHAARPQPICGIQIRIPHIIREFLGRERGCGCSGVGTFPRSLLWLQRERCSRALPTPWCPVRPHLSPRGSLAPGTGREHELSGADLRLWQGKDREKRTPSAEPPVFVSNNWLARHFRSEEHDFVDMDIASRRWL